MSRDEQIEKLFCEVMHAIEKGALRAEQLLENNIDSDFLKICLKAGGVYHGEIGKAICDVFKKYTESEGNK